MLLLQAAAARADDPAPEPTRWEGAIGLNASSAPEYQGSDRRRLNLSPAFFLRWGRVSVTNASGFVTRRADDVTRGLGLDLSSSERWRVGLGLRYDRGRQESTSGALAGLGDIPATLRVRAAASYHYEDWRLGGTWSVDAFGRGGGNFGDLTLTRDVRTSPGTVWTAGASLALAGDRYMQSYFGISQEQSARTGYPVYEPRAGLRDFTLSLGLRSELSHDWVLLASATRSRLLGPAAASPLTMARDSWTLGAGLAWRF